MPSPKAVAPPRTFQDLIFALQTYWAKQGCVILQPYDMEMGAGTFHTATLLRAVGSSGTVHLELSSPLHYLISSRLLGRPA